MHSLIRIILFGALIVTFSVSSNAETEDAENQIGKRWTCDQYLDHTRYQISETFMQQTKPSFIAEPGSIESKNPGLIRQLLQVRVAILALYKTYNSEFHCAYNAALKEALATDDERPSRSMIQLQNDKAFHKMLTTGIEVFINDLNKLGSKEERDPRFLPLLKNVIAYAQSFLKAEKLNPGKPDLEGAMRLITSSMWEMIVACLFEGKEIYLNQKVSDLYTAEFSALKITRADRPKFDRELDIAILKEDGSWRWIEVKDWSPENTRNHERLITLISQSKAQDNIRKLLSGIRVELNLLLKFGLSEEGFRLYGMPSSYDNIYYVFPNGTDDASVVNLGNLRAF